MVLTRALSLSGRVRLAVVRLVICAGLISLPFLGPPVAGWSACSAPPQLAPPGGGLYFGLGDPGRQIAVAIFCGLAFAIGHLLSHLLDPRPRPSLGPIGGPAQPAGTRWRKQPLYLFLVVALLAMFLSLIGYEWFAIYNGKTLFAISYYVRCGNWIATYRTVGLAAAATFALGSWLRFGWR